MSLAQMNQKLEHGQLKMLKDTNLKRKQLFTELSFCSTTVLPLKALTDPVSSVQKQQADCDYPFVYYLKFEGTCSRSDVTVL